MKKLRAIRTATLAVVGLVTFGLVLIGCSDESSMTSGGMDDSDDDDGGTYSVNRPPTSVQPAQNQGASSGAAIYRADLTPLDGSGVTGQVEIGVKADQLGVSVNARGLEASVVHPQHIHKNSACVSNGGFAFGGVIIPLDDKLAVGGGEYPVATPGGTINYKEHASKSAVEGMVDGPLDLANRTVVVHAKTGAPVACGELDKTGS